MPLLTSSYLKVIFRTFLLNGTDRKSERCRASQRGHAILCLLSLLVLGQSVSLQAQQKVELRDFGERVVCIVPVVGEGTPKDPKRPLFVPLPGKEMEESGILSFSFELASNGQVALVEFVAKDRSALKPILESKRTDIKVLERGKFTKEDLEREFRQHKPDFDADKFAEGRK